MPFDTIRATVLALIVFTAHGYPAVAQETVVPPSAATIEPSRLEPATDGGVAVKPFNRTVRELEGAEIRGRWNARVGRVIRVLNDDGGRPAAVAADVGDYAGTREPVVLPLDQLLDQTGYLMVTLSGPQLDALPRWQP